jgi:HlyD family secretion protein
MSRRTKIGVAVALVVLVVAGVIGYRVNKKKHAGTEVRLEQVSRRDLVSAVTASGKIEAKTSVDISADITGRIIEIAVREGDMVKRGQFLLQIDPAQYQAAVARAQGVVASTEAVLLQTRASRDQAQRAWNRARQLTELGDNLIAPETAEQSKTALEVAEANYSSTKAQLEQARAGLQEAKDNLSKTRLTAPITGRVVRLAVEQGEVAVPGTFSRETGLLMTIADLSVILAKVQVDETDVVRLTQRDSAEITIDAYPDTTFTGRVTKVSHSAKLTPTIIALTVRDHEKLPNEADSAPPVDTLRAKFRKKEAEGVFIVRNGIATFRPVKTGVAGDEYFEVTDGLREGETIVAGTYQAIRDLKDGAKVKAADTTKTKEVKS